MSKRARKEIMEEAIIQSTLGKRGRSKYGDISGMLKESLAELSQAEKLALQQSIEKSYHKGIDLGYIRSILFPEQYISDVPQSLTNLAFSRFTDKQQLTVSSGGTKVAGTIGKDGSGMLVWFPKVNQGPSLFILDRHKSLSPQQTGGWTLTDPEPGLKADGSLDETTTTGYCSWRVGGFQKYANYFQQTNLVSASIQIQYIGAADQHSGIMVGSHVYGITQEELNPSDIENGQFYTNGSPSQGLRFTYIPMEATDYEFYPASTNNAHNAGAQPTGNEKTVTLNLLKPNIVQSSTGPTTGTNCYYKDLGGNPIQPDTMKKLMGAEAAVTDLPLTYATNTPYIAIYWDGLAAQQNSLRIDMIRRFNGMPKHDFRDIMGIQRSSKDYDFEKTVQVIKHLGRNVPIGGHTLSEMDENRALIDQGLHNIPALELSSIEPMGLSELGAHLSGQAQGSTGRIYPF